MLPFMTGVGKAEGAVLVSATVPDGEIDMYETSGEAAVQLLQIRKTGLIELPSPSTVVT
jgi:hypothetical protein